jgi:hypothetical protein
LPRLLFSDPKNRSAMLFMFRASHLQQVVVFITRSVLDIDIDGLAACPVLKVYR